MADNTIKDADVAAKVADVEFTRAFEDDTRKLAQILGVFQPIRRAPGTALKYYETSGTLESGKVAEGADIPLSKYARSGQRIASLDWNKWAKETTLEAVTLEGWAEAMDETDKQMVKDIHKQFRTDLVTFLKTGTGKASDGKAVHGATLQSCLANIWGETVVKFENTDATPICFMNPLDIAKYLGTATITNTGTVAFGMTYLENFLGMYPVITLSDVTPGTILCTPRENLHIYYADVAAATGFNFQRGQFGYLGVHHEVTYKNMTAQTYAVSALKPFCDYLDRIWVAQIAETVDA